MSKSIVRKHSAKVLSYTDVSGERKFYACIGGMWYYCGNGGLPLSPASRMPNGLWRDSIKEIVRQRSGKTWNELNRYYLDSATNIKVAIHHWTTEQVVPGVPF